MRSDPNIVHDHDTQRIQYSSRPRVDDDTDGDVSRLVWTGLIQTDTRGPQLPSDAILARLLAITNDRLLVICEAKARFTYSLSETPQYWCASVAGETSGYGE